MLKGKCALVTGSTAGQGRQIAAALAAQGADIVLNGLGDPDEIEQLRSELSREHGVAVLYHGANLAEPEQVDAMVRTASEKFSGVDILVNNAVVRHFASMETYPLDGWQLDLAVNLTAPFLATRGVLPGMRHKGWGRIINMSSNQGLFGTSGRVGYVTTKTALLGLTRATAVETAGTMITCNALCPSAMIGLSSESRIEDKMREEGLSFDDAKARFLAERQASRFVETIPAVVTFLCSDAGRDITGASIPVDLGSTAGRPAAGG
jgi:3-hydroxybutyrate dehydrogenase